MAHGAVLQSAQQYYDPNAGLYKAAVVDPNNPNAAAGYYAAAGYGNAGYGAAEYGGVAAAGGDGSPAYQVPAAYAGAGFAAVGSYNAYSPTPGAEGAAPSGTYPGQGGQQI
jgi:hypothetical protein